MMYEITPDKLHEHRFVQWRDQIYEVLEHEATRHFTVHDWDHPDEEISPISADPNYHLVIYRHRGEKELHVDIAKNFCRWIKPVSPTLYATLMEEDAK